MFDGFVFVLKAILLTESLTNAVKNWGIFETIRSKIKRVNFFNELLSCFECTSVWVSFFVVAYLLFFEWSYFTYVMIAQRVACFVQVGYQLLDAMRAVKEKEI